MLVNDTLKDDKNTAANARRTQAERSAATRAALAEAAIELLIERGWAAVTAAEVCKRAGLSRGAFHHHYANLPSLLADALRRYYVGLGRPARPAPKGLVARIDRTWEAIGDPRFKAVIEAWLAMANDPSLAGEIGPVVSQFSALVWPDTLPPEQREFYLVARETMLGLALGRATNGGRPLGHEPAVLARLRAEAASVEAGVAVM